MLVTIAVENAPFRSVWMRFIPESDDELQPRAGDASFEKLRETPVVVELAPESRVQAPSDLHPDLVALSALLVCGQLSLQKLRLPVRPSEEMINAAKKFFAIEMCGEGPAPSQRSKGELAGLAFSGGVDSCAALLVMPASTVSVFMHRFYLEESKQSVYNSSAALRSVAALQASGRSATALRSNVETVRTPVGFPVDWSNALPLVMNAESLDLSSVSFGTVLESASSLGKMKFSKLASRTIYVRWSAVFTAASLSLSLPVASLSEVATSKIVRERGSFIYPQSCVRGTPGEPCERCFKCFRKSLTEWALGGAPMSDEKIALAAVSKGVDARLRRSPVHHEIGFAWALANIESRNPLLSALKTRAEAFVSVNGGLDFLERPYWPNVQLYVPNSIRPDVVSLTSRAFEASRATDALQVERWDAQQVIETESYQLGLQATVAELNKLAQRD